MSKKYITLKQLRGAGACASTLKTFEQLFGSRMSVSEKRAVEAAEAGLDINWATEKLLRAPARAAYRRIRDDARADYWRILADARAEHKRIADDAWAEYCRTKAATFARLYREG